MSGKSVCIWKTAENRWREGSNTNGCVHKKVPCVSTPLGTAVSVWSHRGSSEQSEEAVRDARDEFQV